MSAKEAIVPVDVVEQVEWNVRDHIPLAAVTVQSHRGAGVLLPENTWEAFERAWNLGTLPEADLRTTRDGVIVAFHDKNLARLFPHAPEDLRRQGVQDLDWQTIRAFGGSEGPPVPSLASILETLAAHPDRRMYIDIKNVDLEQLARQAAAAGATRQLILASTDYALIRHWKALAPETGVETLLWMGGDEQHLAQRLDVLGAQDFDAITQLQVHVRRNPGEDGTASEWFQPSSRFLAQTGRRLRAHGILFQVLPYDVQDAPTLWRLLDLGVASFATDYPDIVRQALRQYYEQPQGTTP